MKALSTFQIPTWALLVVTLAVPACDSHGLRIERLLVVVSKPGNRALILDREQGRELASIVTGVGPHQVAAHGGAGLAVVTNYGSRENPGSSLTVIDLRRKMAIDTIDLGRHRRPHGIVFLSDPRMVLVAVASTRSLLRVNLESGEVEQVYALRQRGPRQVVVNKEETRAYVANLESGTVSVVELQGGAAGTRVKVGKALEGLALSPDGSRLWVSDSEQDLLSVIDTETLEVVDQIDCPSFPVRLLVTASGQHLLVSKARSSAVAVFRIDSHEQEADISMVADRPDLQPGEDLFDLRAVPVEMALSPDRPIAFVANPNADVISVIDLQQWRVIRWMEGAAGPEGIVAVNLFSRQP